MAKLMIFYGHPADPAAFEDYYANRHIPYASKHMPNVRGAENMRVISTADGGPAPYYRVSMMSYDSVAELRAGIAPDEGQSAAPGASVGELPAVLGYPAGCPAARQAARRSWMKLY